MPVNPQVILYQIFRTIFFHVKKLILFKFYSKDMLVGATYFDVSGWNDTIIVSNFSKNLETSRSVEVFVIADSISSAVYNMNISLLTKEYSI